MARIDPATVRKIVIPKQAQAAIILTEVHSEFIALPSNRRKPPGPGQEPEYRSLEAAENPSSSSSDSENPSEESDEEFTAPVNPVSETNSRLTAAVKAEPTSVPAWLELLEHSISGAATSEARSDIALSILEKALAAHWSNKSNVSLRSSWLLAGSSIWSAEKLAEEWEATLKQTQRSPFSERADLWMDYLTYRLKIDAVSGLEEVVKRIWDVVEREAPSEDLDLFKLRVLWRCCVGISELGEKSKSTPILIDQRH